jgi:hypothetical protein
VLEPNGDDAETMLEPDDGDVDAGPTLLTDEDETANAPDHRPTDRRSARTGGAAHRHEGRERRRRG